MSKIKSKKIAFKIVAIFLVLGVVLFFYNYQLNIKVSQEYGSLPTTVISDMILREMSDEVIIDEINRNTSLANEEIYDDLIGMRTPLITAAFYKRDIVAWHIIKNGGQVEVSINLLKEAGESDYKEYIDLLRQWQIDCQTQK